MLHYNIDAPPHMIGRPQKCKALFLLAAWWAGRQVMDLPPLSRAPSGCDQWRARLI